MIRLDKNGVQFFKRDLLEETNRQLEMFEKTAPPEIAQREFGRLRLYDDRMKIERHFLITRQDLGAYEDSHPFHGLIGPLDGGSGSACLIWKELEGLRHSLSARVEENLVWKDQEPPEARLSVRGEFTPKKRHESLT